MSGSDHERMWAAGSGAGPDGRLLPAHRQSRGRAREEHRGGAPGVVRPGAFRVGRAIAGGDTGRSTNPTSPASGCPSKRRSARWRRKRRAARAPTRRRGPRRRLVRPRRSRRNRRSRNRRSRLSKRRRCDQRRRRYGCRRPPLRWPWSPIRSGMATATATEASASNRRPKCPLLLRSARAGRPAAAALRFWTAA